MLLLHHDQWNVVLTGTRRECSLKWYTKFCHDSSSIGYRVN